MASASNGGAAVEAKPEVRSHFPFPPKVYYEGIEPSVIRATLPPPPPTLEEGFQSFGQERRLEEVTPTLAALGFETLYDTRGDPQVEMKKLLDIIKQEMINALNVAIDAKATSDNSATDSDRLHVAFVNALYVVNECRTRQAREELVDMLKTQIKAKKAAIVDLKAKSETARREILDALEHP